MSLNIDVSPAPIDKRVFSGVFDFVAVAGISAAYFLVPLLTRGLVLPMWGVFLAVVGYSVVPLSVFRQTLGMKLFGTELITRDGHPVGLADVLFRELIGRGLFPAAFLFTAISGLIASALHLAQIGMPGGWGVLVAVGCAFLFVLALLGHLLALTSPDRRTLADRMAKSYVVPAQKRLAPVDAEERADWRAERSRKVRGVVIAELVMIAVAVALPWVLTTRHESTAQHAERLLRGKLEVQFKQDPANETIAGELSRAYRSEGQGEKSIEVAQKYETARAAQLSTRMASLRVAFEKNPGDDQTFLALLEPLQDKDPIQAKAMYALFLAQHRKESAYRAAYADWLQAYGWPEEGVAELRGVLADEPDFEGVHTFLAQALAHVGQLPEAQLEFHRALLVNPDDEDAMAGLEEVDQSLGPLPTVKQAELQKAFKASQAKAR